MKKISLFIFLFLLNSIIFSNSDVDSTKISEKLNFSFEYISDNVPLNWYKWEEKGSGKLEITSKAIDGKNSVKISDVKGYIGLISQVKIPFDEIYKETFTKKPEIKIYVYVKGENTTGGYAGVWYYEWGWIGEETIDLPSGTYDWKKVEITLKKIPQRASTFCIALCSKTNPGSIWFDKIEVLINGIELEKIIARRLKKIKGPSEYAYLLDENKYSYIWFEIPTQKVFLTTSPPQIKKPEIIINGAKGEFEPFQLAVTPKENFLIEKIEPTNLISDSGEIIEKSNIEIYEERFVKKEYQFRPSGPKEGFLSLIGEEIPDPLVPKIEDFNLVENKNKVFWINVKIPKNVSSGSYKGAIILKFQNQTIKLPLKLNIYDFEMPEKSFLKVIAHLWGNYMWKYDKRPYKETIREYAENIFSHRIRGITVPLPDVDFDGNNLILNVKSKSDCSEIYKYLKNVGFDYFLTSSGVWLSDTGWKENLMWPGKEERKFKIMTPEFEKYYIQYLKEISKFLEEVKCRDNMILYIWDEPWEELTTMKNLRTIFKWVKENTPELTTFMTNEPNAFLLPYIDIWCPPLGAFSTHHVFIENRRMQKEKIYSYSSTQYFLDQPLLNTRIIFWFLYKYKIEGFLLWCINYWSENPWEIVINNGDGYFLYPDLKGGKPFNSIRWEIFREGIEDYDYFIILEDALNTVNKHLKELSEKECEEINLAYSLLEKVYQLASDISFFDDNPVKYHLLKEEIARSIVNIKRIKEKITGKKELQDGS